MATWLDVVLATPTIGFQFEPSFRFPHEIEAKIAPLVDKWLHEGVLIQTARGENNGSVIVEAGPIRCTITLSEIAVGTRHDARVVELPGKRPILQYGDSEAQKFSELLEMATSRMGALLDYLVPTSRPLLRVGVVANCRLDPEGTPPGVKALANHLAKPWGAELASADVRILGYIERTETHADRCHHHLKIDNDDRAGDVRVQLDWQRVFTKPEKTSATNMKSRLPGWTKDAVTYFDRFAEGDLNYE